MGKIYFVSGIDTDAGKSYATGILARQLISSGKQVGTMKMIQTGCAADQISEDIVIHRRLMGIELLPEDLDHTTCPVRLSFPASPDLAARMDGVNIDLGLVTRNAQALASRCDVLLLEGAGGLMVPICGEYTMADYIADHNLSLILVTNPRLGSVNHTLLSLELCRFRGIRVEKLIYNLYPETSPEITADTRRYLISYIKAHFPGCEFMEIAYQNIQTV